MVLLEAALEFLAGCSFKQFLRRHTHHPVKAILSGIGITAILQSSSVVSLMVLAFVGAGIISITLKIIFLMLKIKLSNLSITNVVLNLR